MVELKKTNCFHFLIYLLPKLRLIELETKVFPKEALSLEKNQTR